MGVRVIAIAVCVFAIACGDDTAPMPDGATACVTNADCSDGLFCTGIEQCAPTAAEADARGCVARSNPCLAGQECSEGEARCVTVDCSLGDVDGDGVESVDCGGTDCDDADADRFPGNAEICDTDAHDEDCDPETLGGDEDGDGYEPIECCNGTRCGQDCDDSRDGVSPEGVEACNGVDEDCDGTLDEGASQLFYRDLDGDGYGDPATGVMRACVPDPLFSAQADDCDDRDPATNPAAAEICDGRDNDCNPATAYDQDRDGDGHLAADAPCSGGSFPLDDCDDSNPFANGGALERCSGVDDDCDGTVDEAAADDWCTAQSRLTGDTMSSALCGAGATCLVSTCGAGRADCDGVVGNGCEVDTTNDATACGGCGISCASGVCTDSLCVPASGSEVPSGFVRVRAGRHGACGVTDDGRALCWGGAVPLAAAGRPQFLSGSAGPLTGVVDVGVSDACACTLMDDGQILCAGTVNQGADGVCNGTGVTSTPFVTEPMPVLASDGSPLIASALSVGEDLGCAIVPSATVEGVTYTDAVACWGGPSVGDGSGGGSSVPALVVGDDGSTPISGVTALDSGLFSACAITGGVVRCWGGEGPNDLAADPGRALVVPKSGGVDLTAQAIWVGEEVACALEGTTGWCWGNNGALAIDPDRARFGFSEAVQIPGSWAEIAPAEAIVGGRPQQTCGRWPDGTVECWGDNVSADTAPTFGCEGSNRCVVQSPQLVDSPASALAAGSGFTCGVFGDGWIWCWGIGASGDLGARVGAIDRAFPSPIPDLSPPVQIEAAFGGACARSASGVITCWGYPGIRGAPTVGTEVDRDDNRKDAAIRLTGLPAATDFSSGQALTCIVDAAGSVRCIGALDPALGIDDAGTLVDFGFLGGASRRAPDDAYTIPGLSGVRDIELGSAHACALKNDGTVWCWGESIAGATGEIGADDCFGQACTLTPRQVTGLPAPVAELALGGFFPFGIPGFSCARLIDGRVACWGNNEFGNLGDGSRMDSATPVLVQGLDDVVELESASLHTCARLSDGQQVCWGADGGGTLGTTRALASCGLSPCSPVPVRAVGVSGVETIGVGLDRTCASTVSGDVFCWGGGEAFAGDTGPVPSAPVAGIAFPISLIASLDSHCGLSADAVRCWGSSRASIVADALPDAPESFVPATYVPGL